MDTLSVIIVVVLVLLLADAFLIYYIRRKRKGQFKLVIEKGVIAENIGDVPAEFLYDIQQLFRISKPKSLIINGIGINSSDPKLTFVGHISEDLKNKMKHSLKLSLQD